MPLVRQTVFFLSLTFLSACCFSRVKYIRTKFCHFFGFLFVHFTCCFSVIFSWLSVDFLNIFLEFHFNLSIEFLSISSYSLFSGCSWYYIILYITYQNLTVMLIYSFKWSIETLSPFISQFPPLFILQFY